MVGSLLTKRQGAEIRGGRFEDVTILVKIDNNGKQSEMNTPQRRRRLDVRRET